MKNAVIAALIGGALAAPQAPAKAPDASAPSGCDRTREEPFTINVVAPVEGEDDSSRSEKRQNAGPLIVHLRDGVLTDDEGRTGSIVANFQFQFDNPVQPDAIYTSGFSACDDGFLALGDSKLFYKCESGEFSNLYDRNWAPDNCEPISFSVLPVDGGSTGGGGGSSGSTQTGGGQGVTQITDGQPQAPTGQGVSQIDDGQPQAPTGAAPTGQPISQIDDGQPQAPTGAAPTGQPVSQIPDGQPQAPTGAAPAPAPPAPSGQPVSQIPDGQPQAPTGAAPAPAPPAPSGQPVSQIPDGQPQAPTGAAPPASNNTGVVEVQPNVGGKVVPGSMVAVVMGLFGLVLLL